MYGFIGDRIVLLDALKQRERVSHRLRARRRGTVRMADSHSGEEGPNRAQRWAPPTRTSGAWCAALLGVAAALRMVQPSGYALLAPHVFFHEPNMST